MKDTNVITAKAALNDAFRKSGKGIVLTLGVRARIVDLVSLFTEVFAFNTFTEDNDPHQEHDFGSVILEDQKIFWKIDYYDQDLKYWCDPLSSDCRRIMTIMLAEEY